MSPALISSRNEKISVPPSNWYEVPPLFVSLGDLIKELEKLRIRDKTVNVTQIKNVLKNQNLPEQFLAKLRGTWLILHDDRAEAGPLLKDILKLHKGFEEEAQKTGNLSDWRRYFEEKGWLYKFADGGIEVRNL